MKQSSSWMTWATVALLLIFAGIASAVVPLFLDEIQSTDDGATTQERGATSTTLDVAQLPFVGELLVELDIIQDTIQGRTITLLQAFGITIGAVLVSVGGLGLVFTGTMFLYSRLVDKVYADESYQTATAELATREATTLKQLAEDHPPSKPEDFQKRVRNSTIIFGILIVMLAGIAALAIGVSVLDSSTFNLFGLELSAGGFALIVALITGVILILVLLRRQASEDVALAESDYKPVDWGIVWVLITGLIVVGVGAGIAIAFSSTG